MTSCDSVENLRALTFSLNSLAVVIYHLGTEIFSVLECSQFMKLLCFSIVSGAYNSMGNSERKESFLDEYGIQKWKILV